MWQRGNQRGDYECRKRYCACTHRFKNLKKVHEILATLGLTVSDFIRIAFTKVINERRLPFEMYASYAKRLKLLRRVTKGKIYTLLKT
ncbi:type II toxin-antitoxin system RelB/DinJ family antitoxin [Bartonella birtlesii]|uniref:type II toxin-antitoxin system RelB/DinJ family antitoxin n=1 Tax=Bartonella birtlesii TaxID=111504 RepID=UPI001FCCB515|nr:type II toxin-antitoxin system RelB/DinJ family antitoxin [Bartonella birtlesii]